jgi:tight adherence protein C
MSSEIFLAAVLSALLLIGGAVMVFSASRSRRRAISGRLQLITAVQAGAEGEASSSGSSQVVGAALMRGPTGGMSQAELREISRVCRWLDIPVRHAPTVFTWLRVTPALVLAVAGFVLARLELRHAPAVVLLLIAAVFAFVGWLTPAIILEHATKRHAEAVASGLPEGLELLVVCVEAGLSLEDAIDRSTAEIQWSQPALAEELTLTSADLKILPSRDQALGNLALRVDAPAIRSVVTSLSQTLKYGTPLAQALRVTASELRNDSLILMEERANRLPTLLTLPLMLCIMPTIFLLIGGPAALRLIDLFASR